jgi:hypothetical protein
VCFAGIFGHAPVLAQLLLQLYQQQGSKAGAVLGHIVQGPRAVQQLSLALLKVWRGDTNEATAAAEAVARQQQEQAEVRAGLQHLAVGLLVQQRYGEER